MRSSLLLKNNGVPAFTRSPGFTNNLGVTPSKSRGDTAYGGRRRFGQLLGGAAPEIDVETLA